MAAREPVEAPTVGAVEAIPYETSKPVFGSPPLLVLVEVQPLPIALDKLLPQIGARVPRESKALEHGAEHVVPPVLDHTWVQPVTNDKVLVEDVSA